MRESFVLKGVVETAYRWQACRETRGIPLYHMRESVLLEELPHDPHIYLPQGEARGAGPDPVFLVTTWTELARRAAEIF